MTIDNRLVIITTLAEYQSEFWLLVCRDMISRGCQVMVLAFDDRSADLFAANDIVVSRITMDRGVDLDGPELDRQFAHCLNLYGIDNVNMLFSHQRITFRIRDTKVLERTFVQYSHAIEAALDAAGVGKGNAVMLQELGGFLSVIASYYAARRRAVDNWFIEPSFFRGRLSLRANSFAAPKFEAQPAAALTPAVKSYLDETLARQSIVIPEKDRHQYRSVASKVLNFKNLRRLAQKSLDKYVLGKHQDFGHIGVHIRSHLEMIINAVRTRRLYRGLETAEHFIYYPLHVPADMALTLRSPEYLDQVTLVSYLLRTVPRSHKVAIKEHPAQIGAIPYGRLAQLSKTYDNLVILSPTTNNFTVLNRADAVVTVNSKSGAEAMLIGKPAVVLGDAFYDNAPAVTKVSRLADLGAALRAVLDLKNGAPTPAIGYFQNVYDGTVPGELYVSNAANIETFTTSVLDTMMRRPEPTNPV